MGYRFENEEPLLRETTEEQELKLKEQFVKTFDGASEKFLTHTGLLSETAKYFVDVTDSQLSGIAHVLENGAKHFTQTYDTVNQKIFLQKEIFEMVKFLDQKGIKPKTVLGENMPKANRVITDEALLEYIAFVFRGKSFYKAKAIFETSNDPINEIADTMLKGKEIAFVPNVTLVQRYVETAKPSCIANMASLIYPDLCETTTKYPNFMPLYEVVAYEDEDVLNSEIIFANHFTDLGNVVYSKKLGTFRTHFMIEDIKWFDCVKITGDCINDLNLEQKPAWTDYWCREKTLYIVPGKAGEWFKFCLDQVKKGNLFYLDTVNPNFSEAFSRKIVDEFLKKSYADFRMRADLLKSSISANEINKLRKIYELLLTSCLEI